MSDNRAVIELFYWAFARRDGDAMAACYHPDVHFQDPVFDLHGAEAGAMWRMLCKRAVDLAVEVSGISVEADNGRAHWEARYTFTTTGRKVHNRIDAQFTFRDGLIINHEDNFGFHRWARQALGPAGLLLGWSGFLRKKVRAQAAENLRHFQTQPAA
jgi:ketosteroid isomerase-like protein